MVHQQNVFTISGFPIMDITSLDELEDQLDPQMFFRANRQFIINIDAIASVKPIENSKLRIKTVPSIIKIEAQKMEF